MGYALIKATEYIVIHAALTMTLADQFYRSAESLNTALFLPGDLRLVLKGNVTKAL